MEKKETRGGYRKGAKRPLKYGEPTKVLKFSVPVSKVEKITEIVKKQLSKWQIKKSPMQNKKKTK